MKEDYVSFEIAELLKEKGFPVNEFIGVAWYNGIPLSKVSAEFIKSEALSPIPQSAVLKWLRNNYNLHIIICIDDLDWSYQIVNFKNKLDVQYIKDLAGFNSYESAYIRMFN